jgi:hypothetical protein
MAGTPEEDLLGWLEREEESLGFSAVADALGDIESARALLYDELGYDITESQFEALTGASALRYEELPSVSVSYGRYEQAWGYQATYRDIATGRFVSAEDVFSLLSVVRGL